MEAPPRFELGIKALQASALPLGYGAELNFPVIREVFSPHENFAGRAKKSVIPDKISTGRNVFGAEDEIRTRDIRLGKATYYHCTTPARTFVKNFEWWEQQGSNL